MTEPTNTATGRRLSASTALGQLRVDAGLTQTAVAHQLGLGAQALVSMVERGTKPLTRDLAEAMAALYDVPLSAVIEAAPLLGSSARNLEADAGFSAAEHDATLTSEVDANATSDAAPLTMSIGAASSEGSDHSREEGNRAPTEDEPLRATHWFVGSDTHSTRRREVRDAALINGFTPTEAQLIAVASHPQRSDFLSTYDFYMELQELIEDFQRQARMARDAGMPPLARLTLGLMQGVATRHGSTTYAAAFTALTSSKTSTRGTEREAMAEEAPEPPSRELEHLRSVVTDRRSILVEEPNGVHARRFDVYATATRGDCVLASGFDHQRGLIRAINLSTSPTRPHKADAPGGRFDPPQQHLVDKAVHVLKGLSADIGSIRVVNPTAAKAPALVPAGRAESAASHDSPVLTPASGDQSVLPTAIDLAVGSHHLLLDREFRTGGAIGFALTDPDTGKPARGGVRLADDQELPDSLTIGDHRVELESTHRWLPDENRFSTDPEPLDQVRASHARLAFNGNIFEVNLRLARRSSAQWSIRAKLTPAQRTPAKVQEDDMPPKPSIKGAPVLPTPLFKLDGRWNWRWSVQSRDSQLILPRELFELNGVEAESLQALKLGDGTTVALTPTKYGTGLAVNDLGALRKASGGKPGDYVFIAVDGRGTPSFHRVTKQLMGRVQSHMKMASLLCGLTDEHPTMAAVLWALGLDDEAGTIKDAIAICEQRSDGPLARELRSQATEAGPPPDLDEIFKAL